ncbi:unnamed protein product [Effrenium voratum]|nr:unnamed protein product [Effrenium voratum]
MWQLSPHGPIMSRVGAAPLWPSAQLSDAELGREDAVHALTVRPPEHLKPGQVFETSAGGLRFLVRLPSSWAGEPVTAYYQVDSRGAWPAFDPSLEKMRFCTVSCCFSSGVVMGALILATLFCVLPYVLFPAVGLVLLSIIPIVVFGCFAYFLFQNSVRILQMVISFFEAIAWFIPLVGVILIIYFPVGWDDWLPACDETTNATDAVQWDCLGKKAIQAYLMTSFLEELLKFLCVRRLLWQPFVCDAWALCCYGGCAGLGFAAVENAIYVGTGGLVTALLRAGTAVPNHLMYGLMHGAFLSQLRFAQQPRCTYLLTPFLPMLLHGSHNFSIAVLQFLDPWAGLSLMVLVAMVAMLTLRWAIQGIDSPVVNVHELIEMKVVEAPYCCLCCQGTCGWALAFPPSAPLSSQPGGQLVPLGEPVRVRGVGAGTFEAETSEVSAMASAEMGGKVYFESVVGPCTQNARIGVRSAMSEGTPGGDELSWAWGREGLWHKGELIQARTSWGGSPEPLTIGCLVDMDDGFLHFHDPNWAFAPVPLPAGPKTAVWSFAGKLGVRLAGRFAEEPPTGYGALKAAACSGQVVGILLSDSQEE